MVPRIESRRAETIASLAALHEQIGLPLQTVLKLSSAEFAQLDEIIRHEQQLRRGEHVFRTGQPFRAIYAINSGCIKTYRFTDSGEEQVTGFHMAGEFLGLDSLRRRYHCSAKALIESSVSEVPLDQLEELARKIPNLQSCMLRILSDKIAGEEDVMLLLAKKSAEQRMAALLLSLSSRYHELGLGENEFDLCMSRDDIGNYLGLALATVSRILRRFHEQGFIRVRGRHIRIENVEHLRDLAAGPHDKTDRFASA